MRKEMNESVSHNPFRHGQEAGKPQIPRPSVLSDEQRADVHALRASRRAQQAAVTAAPIPAPGEMTSQRPPGVTPERRAQLQQVTTRVHEGLTRFTETARQKLPFRKTEESRAQEPVIEDVPLSPLSEHDADEFLNNLGAKLKEIQTMHWDNITPREAAGELAKRLEFEGANEQECLAKLRAAYNQALDHASDEAFDRFNKGLQQGRLDRLWVPTEEFLLKESQNRKRKASTSDVETAQPALDPRIPTPATERIHQVGLVRRPGEYDGTLEQHRAKYPEFHLLFDILDEGFGPDFNGLDAPAVWAYLKRLDPSLTRDAVYAQLRYDLGCMTLQQQNDAHLFVIVRGFSTEAL